MLRYPAFVVLFCKKFLYCNPWGVLPHKKGGVLIRNFEEVPRSCFVGIPPSTPPPPEEVPILKQHVISCRIFFQFNTLKGTAKPSACDILRLNTFRSTKTAFLTLEGTTLKYPCPFGVGVPPLRL